MVEENIAMFLDITPAQVEEAAIQAKAIGKESSPRSVMSFVYQTAIDSTTLSIINRKVNGDDAATSILDEARNVYLSMVESGVFYRSMRSLKKSNDVVIVQCPKFSMSTADVATGTGGSRHYIMRLVYPSIISHMFAIDIGTEVFSPDGMKAQIEMMKKVISPPIEVAVKAVLERLSSMAESSVDVKSITDDANRKVVKKCIESFLNGGCTCSMAAIDSYQSIMSWVDKVESDTISSVMRGLSCRCEHCVAMGFIAEHDRVFESGVMGQVGFGMGLFGAKPGQMHC